MLAAERDGLQSTDMLRVPFDQLDTGNSPTGLLARGEVLVVGNSSGAERTILKEAGFAAACGMAGIVMKTAMCAAGPRATVSDPGTRRADDHRGAGVRVAVLDTAIDPADVFAPHGLLADVSVDALGEPNAKLDAAVGHGGFVAGLVRQLVPAAAVQVLTVLAGDGLGTEYGLCAALDQRGVTGRCSVPGRIARSPVTSRPGRVPRWATGSVRSCCR